jgi:hypothetical protein
MSFIISPDPIPSSGVQTLQLIGSGTSWTNDTVWTVSVSGTSILASSFIVDGPTAARWIVQMSGNGSVLLSDGASFTTASVSAPLGSLKIGDLPKVIVDRLRAQPDVVALTSDRISMAFPEGRRAWPMPTYAIIVRPTGGPPPSQVDGRRWSRLDLHFYGSGATPNVRRRTARDLWRTTEPFLCPPPNVGLPSSFQSSGLVVYQITPQRGEPIALPEPDTDWDRVIMSYMVLHARIGLAAA